MFFTSTLIKPNTKKPFVVTMSEQIFRLLIIFWKQLSKEKYTVGPNLLLVIWCLSCERKR